MERSLYSKPYEALRSWLKHKRAENDCLSIRNIADELGIHHSIIGKIEHGDRHLDIIEYVQYCIAIGADPADGIEVIKESLK